MNQDTSTTAHPPPVRHLIVGDGSIGLGVAQALQRRGLGCALASRSGPKGNAPQGSSTPHLRVDARDAEQVLQATQGCTHVYLTLGLPYDTQVWERDWPQVMRSVIDAAVQHGAVLVFFDNLYSYGPAPLQVPITEDHPRHPPSRKGAVRAGLLAQLHDAARTRGLRWVVGRSADFYGPGVRNSALYVSAIERQLQGKAAQWLGPTDMPHSFTYTLDAAEGLVRLALDEGAWQREWHLPTASQPTTPRELLDQSARLLGAPEAVQALPVWAVGLLQWVIPILREYREMLYQNTSPYVFSSAAFLQRYPDFRITPYDEGMRAMVASFRT